MAITFLSLLKFSFEEHNYFKMFFIPTKVILYDPLIRQRILI